MESEARAGEFKWEQAKVQSEQELKRLLGNPAPVPGTAPAKPPAEDTPQNVSGHAPVERAAARDLVGDQIQTAKTPIVSLGLSHAMRNEKCILFVAQGSPSAKVLRQKG